ncbi:hypothetical protein FEM48_Zijuj09G0146800 [Ziziphus jujuba var. spinosa]|uniref:Leucine-rich repeat-containing N-terminal plant-type domain-containing protein n=1 Tax=Ziziphus jujuba var. spinosa TaxID=714518 RepID=A0A978UTK4_ZIZJJ|nr:hypothetical protein FEM48_Zijuj09G0146800 [Ziziphus jujuba var. spinosa]
MLLGSRVLDILTVSLLWVLLSSSISSGVETDINCLKNIKASLEDPFGYLNSSWNFNNNTEGFICKFTGIECWHPDESKVLNIRLPDMGLKGPFPQALANCTSLTGLDLSNNKLYGSIPENISKIIQYVTSLDLSSNNFTGSIPVGLSNLSYLNDLILDHNRLSGSIPLELALLPRLKKFSVANNLLVGPVPNFGNKENNKAENYANNPGLCGGSLEPCNVPPKKSHTVIIVGAVVAGVTASALGVGVGLFFLLRRAAVRKKEEDPEGNKWAKSLKGTKGIKAS